MCKELSYAVIIVNVTLVDLNLAAEISNGVFKLGVDVDVVEEDLLDLILVTVLVVVVVFWNVSVVTVESILGDIFKLSVYRIGYFSRLTSLVTSTFLATFFSSSSSSTKWGKAEMTFNTEKKIRHLHKERRKFKEKAGGEDQ